MTVAAPMPFPQSNSMTVSNIHGHMALAPAALFVSAFLSLIDSSTKVLYSDFTLEWQVCRVKLNTLDTASTPHSKI